MAVVTSTYLRHFSLPQTQTDQRRQLMLAGQARLSGARACGPASNPVDLTVPSFLRISHISTEDTEVVPVRGRRVVEDDIDW
ncbi:hypothetical protein IEZ26_08720 [Nocardioides cavernae]|uniref:Uncharacterized protein n=1 Tax=Nocardioides cavernae TaxID=1921566 RepID=A0ABR8N9Y1_9ACTN|nr:hypothetical protein [Nocardioides cavernae]MBD3924700.1 hypothetical protein [Nocardioides cavernae]MBM7514926.1 hypothetical protein [Nocardioides cavernae]